ncbi:hypothetical protein [Microbacterium terricola]|uniref:Lytic transglycosylase domain-containing protein n=1 Tax=Microbacterium terricola TaxID=344163 RepID=A0ABM8DY55_9MICO|nr:hypothetical protein [Microbacterium terricola]UYK38854.1 hypothetical protein OAU46_09045 [Microbacterium terricola]BDV30450.1 hypothetical protein Microterr_11100 [Microbacterium terricola]
MRKRTLTLTLALALSLGVVPAAAGIDATPAAAASVTTPTVAKSIAKKLVKQRGWSTAQYSCLVKLWQRESGWRVTAGNTSRAYGIPQAYPGTKMATQGKDWRTGATTQIKWGMKYISGRYSKPCTALNHSNRYGWY